MTDQGTLATDLAAIDAQAQPSINDRISRALAEVRQSGKTPGLAVGDPEGRPGV